MKLFGVVEIKLITKKQQVKDMLATEGKLAAIKKCRDLFGYGLTEAKEYVLKLEVEAIKGELER